MINKRSKKEIADFQSKAAQIIKHLIGSSAKKMEYKPAGQTNFVFEADTKDGAFIVRLSGAVDKLADFKKEQWIINKVNELNVPVASIVDVGNSIVDCTYMVQKKIKGIEALYHPEKKKILEQMGEFTARINKVRTKGYGSCFDWSDDEAAKHSHWKDFINKELDIHNRLKIFKENKILSKKHLDKLQSTLENLAGDKPRLRLNHGDMRRKNVLVDVEGKVTAILDWEHSCSNIAPTWDLSIALHDLSVDDKQFFLEGYGISAKKYLEIVKAIKALNIINYAPAIDNVIRLKNKSLLEFYKLRLSGDFDLYSL